MTRFNYRPSAFERVFGRRPRVTVARAIRIPMLTIGAALVLVASVWLFELHRIAQLSQELAAMHERIAAAAAADGRAAATERRVEALRALRASVLTSRRESLETANRIARIGNSLPAETWLTNVRSNAAGEWSIAGRSTSVAHIGTALARFARLEPAANARLVSINGSGASGRILDFIIAWEHE